MKNSALLTEYGFTLDPDGDPDTVSALLPEDGVVDIPTLGGKRFELLRSLNLVGAQGHAATETVRVEHGVRPRMVLAYAAARVMSESQLEHGGTALLAWLLEHGTLPDEHTWQGVTMFGSGKPGAASELEILHREDLRQRIINEVESMLMTRLKQYRTTAGADELLLAEIASKLSRAAERRTRGATDLHGEEAELIARRDNIRVRLGEKRTLMAVKRATVQELSVDSEAHDYRGSENREL
jgi:hypothetical protein